jgi:hypothetical protein
MSASSLLTERQETGMVTSGHSTCEDTMMHVNFELPDEFAQRLQAKWHDTLAHYARERLVMEAYRDELLTSREVGEILGLDRFDVEVLCKKYHISTYALEDFNRDGETLKQLGF